MIGAASGNFNALSLPTVRGAKPPKPKAVPALKLSTATPKFSTYRSPRAVKL